MKPLLKFFWLVSVGCDYDHAQVRGCGRNRRVLAGKWRVFRDGGVLNEFTAGHVHFR